MKRSERIDCIKLKRLVNEIEDIDSPSLELLENLAKTLRYYGYFRSLSITELYDFYFEIMRVAHEVLAEDYAISARHFENVLDSVSMDKVSEEGDE